MILPIGLLCLAFVYGIQFLGEWLEHKTEREEAAQQTFDVVVLPFSSLVQGVGERLAIEQALMARIKSLAKKAEVPLTVRFKEVEQSLENPLDAARAREVGEKELADLAIWGTYEKQVNWDSALFNFQYVYLDEAVNTDPFGEQGETGFLSARSLASVNTGTLTGGIEDIVFWSLGMRNFLNGKYEEAQKLLARVTPRDEQGYALVAFFLAYSYAENQLLDSAKYYYDYTIRLDSTDADAFNNRGILSLHKQRYEDAIADYKRAISLAPDVHYLYRNRGIAFESMRQFDQALKDYTHTITLEPGDGLSYRVRGVLYMTQGNMEAAKADLERGLELGDKSAVSYYLLAIIADGQSPKKIEEVLAHYESAFKLDSLAEHFNGRADFYRRMEDFNLALADLETAIALDSNFAISYGTRAEIYAQQGNSEVFYKNITKALEKGAPVWEFLSDTAYSDYRDAPEFQSLIAPFLPDSLR